MKNHTVLILALVATISGAITGKVMAQPPHTGGNAPAAQEEIY